MIPMFAHPPMAAAWTVLAAMASAPSPSPSKRVLEAPPPDPYQTVGAIAAIVLALAAGILAYRVIRGGRGL